MSGAQSIAVVVAAILVLTGCAGPDEPPAAGPAASSDRSEEAPTTAASPHPSRPPHRSRAPRPSGPPRTPSAAPTSAEAPTPAEAPAPPKQIEVPSSTPSAAALPGLTPVPSPDRPLVRRPLPPPGLAHGRLVEGYPRRILPPVQGTDIDTSSLGVHGRRLQVTLTGRTRRSADAVLLFYRLRLTSLGFTEVGTPTSDLTEVDFRHGKDVATLSVTGSAGEASYSLISTLHAD